MKRIMTIILMITLLISNLHFVVVAEETETIVESEIVVTPDMQEAKEVLDLLTEKELFPDAKVTREKFVSAVIDFMRITPYSPTDYFFEDVEAFKAYADAVYTAVDMGWISKNNSFEPEREIVLSEALKIMIRLLNYDLLSDTHGGYPVGDAYVAEQLDLLVGVNTNADGLSDYDAYMLLYNVALTSCFKQIVYGVKEQYTDAGETLLETVYDVYTVEGIMNRTIYNSLDAKEKSGLGNYIEIDGINYETTIGNWDMLGAKVRAFVKKNETSEFGTALYIRDLSRRLTISLTDFENKDEHSLSYWINEGKDKETVDISPSAHVIFNGRKIITNIDECFEKAAGNIVLVDNNKNYEYDIIYINYYDYAIAREYNTVTKMFRDKNGNTSTVSLDKKATIVYDTTGQEMDLLDIQPEQVFRMLRSRDDGFVYMRQLEGESISGFINSINVSDKSITIDDVDYIMSDYFIRYFIDKLKVGIESSFTVDGNIIIASDAISAVTNYGYLVAADWSNDIDMALLLKIFTSAETFEIYKVRNKVILDSRSSTPNEVYNTLCPGGVVNNQLIRYALSDENEVKIIDTATTRLPDVPGVYPDKNNCLTKYENMAGSMRLSQGTGTMGGKYTIIGTKVFCIPFDDLTNEKLYQVRESSYLTHGNTYNFEEIYDINESGGAGVVVFNGGVSDSYASDQPFLMIEEIGKTLNEDGEEVYNILGLLNDQYVTYTLDSDVSVTKNATTGTPVKSVHPLLSSGDLIAVGEKDGEISVLDVIFDARDGVMASNVSTNVEASLIPGYYEGMVYDVRDGYIIVSITKTADGYDFSQDNLRYICITTNNLVMYNAARGFMRQITSDEIKTYRTDGDDAHYAMLHMANFALKTGVFYEDMEARR